MKTLNTLIALALAFLIFECKSKKEEAAGPKNLEAVVVFAVGDAKVIHKDKTEEPASLGSVLIEGDMAKTLDGGKLDIQFPDGSTVRISPNTEINVTQLNMGPNNSTNAKIALGPGKLFVKVEKSKKEDNFSVSTPSAVAGVRGTSFVMETGEGANAQAKLKVVEGVVAMGPRIPALENLTQEQIDNDPKLKSLKDSLDNSAVVVEKNQATSLPANDPKLTSIKDVSNAEELTKVTETVKAAETNKSKVEEAKPSKAEEEEFATVVKVDPAQVKALVEVKQKAQTDPEQAKKLEEEKKRMMEEIAKKQEEEKKKFLLELANKPREFKTEQDILDYYEKIDKIILVKGNKVVMGAIIDQEGDIIHIQTTKGVSSINQNDIDEIDYGVKTLKK
jgi:hypothetical protein